MLDSVRDKSGSFAARKGEVIPGTSDGHELCFPFRIHGLHFILSWLSFWTLDGSHAYDRLAEYFIDFSDRRPMHRHFSCTLGLRIIRMYLARELLALQ